MITRGYIYIFYNIKKFTDFEEKLSFKKDPQKLQINCEKNISRSRGSLFTILYLSRCVTFVIGNGSLCYLLSEKHLLLDRHTASCSALILVHVADLSIKLS